LLPGLRRILAASSRAGRQDRTEVRIPEEVMKTQRPSAIKTAEAGFTLIELLIVMSVILILMTLAVPAMQKVMKHANETSAMQSIRDINTQEEVYNSTYPTHGFSCTLAALGGKPGSGAPSAEAAQLIPEDLASGVKAGYTFSITNCNKVTVGNQDEYTSYEITAVPNQVGKTGDRGYCTDGNEIRYDPKGGTNCTELLQ
jgi:type IV pilus assembly protein PilA